MAWTVGFFLTIYLSTNITPVPKGFIGTFCEIYKKEINKSLSFHDLPYSNFCIFFILLVIEREGMREAWIFEKICLFSLNLINVIVPSFRNALRGNICLHLKLHKKQYSFSLVKSITLWAFRSWQAILHALKKS